MKLNWENAKKICIEKNIVNNKSISDHVPFKDKNFFKDPRKISFWQYYQMKLALNEIVKYEKESNFEN